MNMHTTTETTPLAPCPFCGAPAHGYAIEPHLHSPSLMRLIPELPDHPGSYVIEGQCACGSGLIGADETEVVARWNRRAPQPPTAQAAESVPAVDESYKQALGSKNCMQCCVGYMLGLPLESVPDFVTAGGWDRFASFAESQGYAAVMLEGNHEFEADYLASGATARGTSHMVVMNDGKLVHDPHPSNAGLVEVQCVWLLAKKSGPRRHRDERAAFEASAKAYTSNVSFERDGTDYADMTASLLWHGWKLRASHGQAPAHVLHLVQDAFAEVAMAYPKAFALHKVGPADTAVRKALATPTPQAAQQAPAGAASALNGQLYAALGNLFSHLGAEGCVCADHPFVWDAMTALKRIDGGVYLDDLAVPVEPDAHRDDLLKAVQLLEDGEWAEHFAKTPLGMRLEDQITKLHSEIAAPAAPSTPASGGWMPLPPSPSKDGESNG